MKANRSNEGKKFDPISAGMHLAVCYGLVDLGVQKSEFNGEVKFQYKVLFMFETDEQGEDKDGVAFNRAISIDLTNSLGERAKMRAILESWNGKKFSEPELDNVELKDYIGKPCLLNIQNVTKDSGMYANIANITPLLKGQQPLKGLNEQVYFTMDINEMPFEEIRDRFDKLPEWIRKRIEKSTTYTNLFFGKDGVSAAEKAGLTPVQSDDLPF